MRLPTVNGAVKFSFKEVPALTENALGFETLQCHFFQESDKFNLAMFGHGIL